MMIEIWFFLAYLQINLHVAVTQAGPFKSIEQCTAAQTAWVEHVGHYASACYRGTWK